MNGDPLLLIVIPAYQESKRLPLFLRRLGEEIKGKLTRTRILVVDDGSGPEEQQLTASFISELHNDFPFMLKPLLLPINHGKGGAILAGWDIGGGYDHLAFVDADGAVPATEVVRLVRLLDSCDYPGAIFGSRIRMLGVNVTRTWKRHLSGRIFSFLVGILIERDVYDSQCGLKFIPQKYFMKIRGKLKGMGFAFDVEILSALKSAGCPINEVPINWADTPGSKVSLFKDTVKMVAAVFSIRSKR
jgi:dolichyl-phosphate beta-glucosyltransferase